MTSIEKANQVRSEKALEKQINTSDYGIISKKQFIEKLFKAGATSRIELRHPFQFDRIKYNRMTNANGEQDAYDKKYNEKVPRYEIVKSDESFYEVSKSEYDYFNTLVEKSETENEIIDPVVQSLFKPGGTLACTQTTTSTPIQLNLF